MHCALRFSGLLDFLKESYSCVLDLGLPSRLLANAHMISTKFLYRMLLILKSECVVGSRFSLTGILAVLLQQCRNGF